MPRIPAPSDGRGLAAPRAEEASAALAALGALGVTRLHLGLLEYPIWLDELETGDARPRPGEVVARHVDVTPWRERKRAAVAAHRSQLGLVIDDDPSGFVLLDATIHRLTAGDELYFEVQA